MRTNKLNLSVLVSLFIWLFTISILASSQYRMELEESVKDNNNLEINIYLKSEDDSSFVLTSYQCAISINQNIDFSNTTFTYVKGSSELLNEPNLYVGVEDLDGVNELTFVSYIGTDKISNSKKTLVGTFLLSGEGIGKVSDIGLQWNFDGTVSTIITGKSFDNITNPQYHVCNYTKVTEPQQPPLQSVEQINIVNSVASAITADEYTDKMLYDGKTSEAYISGQSNDKSGRWAVEGFPQWVTLDLGEDTEVESIKLDGYGSEKGITYDCEFYSGNYDNKVLIEKETTQSGTQWSEHELGGVKTRYLTIVVTGSQGNSWCDIWEMEVHGISSASDVTEEPLPSEFGISQNYPNPFNPTTKVDVQMKESGRASLDVFNILGEKVLSVMNEEELNAGIHEVNIDAKGLPSGVYIYKLNVDNNFTQIKKMNLIK